MDITRMTLNPIKFTAPAAFVVCSFVASFAYAQNTAAPSNDDLAQIADSQLQTIEQNIQDGQEMLSDARSKSDVARMDCLNTQLVIVRGFLNVAQNANANLKDAISRNDAEAISHHRKLLDLAASKTGDSYNRMKQCTTGIVSVSGETKSTTIRHCTIEPCLNGESVYAPEQIDKSSLTGANPNEDSCIIDASPYM